ncbi:MAG: DUF3791 domain-containing protein [Treponema sp.]|nr:DUF3791 domain-containing protein [Treponema sp.]
MQEKDFEKKAGFISWCIEEYAALHGKNGRVVANDFAEKNVLDFLFLIFDSHAQAYLPSQSRFYLRHFAMSSAIKSKSRCCASLKVS